MRISNGVFEGECLKLPRNQNLKLAKIYIYAPDIVFVLNSRMHAFWFKFRAFCLTVGQFENRWRSHRLCTEQSGMSTAPRRKAKPKKAQKEV